MSRSNDGMILCAGCGRVWIYTDDDPIDALCEECSGSISGALSWESEDEAEESSTPD